ncbi:MAG: YcfL family protein [Campylobacterales bacterium]|nr:YcfL family protein [Campylobacterales bacterium]
MTKLLSKTLGVAFVAALISGCTPKMCVLPENVSIAQNFCDTFEITKNERWLSENKEVQFQLRNVSSFPQTFIYKVEWKDAQGFVIDSRLNRWQKAELKAGRTHVIDAVAPIAEVSSYVLLIEKEESATTDSTTPNSN